MSLNSPRVGPVHARQHKRTQKESEITLEQLNDEGSPLETNDGKATPSEVRLSTSPSNELLVRKEAFAEIKSESRPCNVQAFCLALVWLMVVVSLALNLLMIFGVIESRASSYKDQADLSSDEQLNVINLRTSLNKTNKELKRLKEEQKIYQNQILEINQVLIGLNNSKTIAGPRGPPGYNGTQGPVGPLGPRGSGNMTMCQYKVAKGPGTRHTVSATDFVSIGEPAGMRIVGATCSTDGAAQYVLTSIQLGRFPRSYKCECKGSSSLFVPAGKMHCYVHYWELQALCYWLRCSLHLSFLAVACVQLGTLAIKLCFMVFQHAAGKNPEGKYRTVEVKRLELELNKTSAEIDRVRSHTEHSKQKLTEMKETLKRLSTIAPPGPQGLPERNGSQCPRGLIGPQGSDDMSLCEYKAAQSVGVRPSSSASVVISTPEPVGKKILAVSCSSDGFAEYIFTTEVAYNIRFYKCHCKGNPSHFIPAVLMRC
ncbi:predicted protein [Nematostella vectensis]|uniref:Uncharacterized protein n=1 Tax=Nematostella vectensis TaxID=45351 RepID=A7S510_NEMVE|nr:predicted protein [Nematostella vectensis]|eukprot:XP_001633349.1 predicted protein [Nematostella vectensis]